ncbi:MAG: hypothetical protein KDA61_05790 [Planctomycetales bacterium]|nr:hypothetical protein [Planctomycetales bacterium]
MIHFNRFCFILTAGSLHMLAGCDSGPLMQPVAGTVSYHGERLKFGNVMFQHASGGQPSTAAIQPDGSFVLTTHGAGEGVRVGPHRVRITCFEGNNPDRPNTLGSGEKVMGKSLIPSRYNSFGGSGLKVIVEAGEDQRFDFELTD